MRKLITVPAMLMLAASMLVFCSNRSVAQDKDKHDMKGMSGDDMQKGMDAMMKAGQPGPEHAQMMKGAGDWDADVKFLDMMTGQWSAPTKGTAHMEPIMDGRYMVMHYKGSMNMGGKDVPFTGMGIMGYDNVKKLYFSTWIDSMSTGMMKTEGTMEGNVCTLKGMMSDPMSGKDEPVKEVVTHSDESHMKYEMFANDPSSGKEMKVMEINYTKKM